LERKRGEIKRKRAKEGGEILTDGLGWRGRECGFSTKRGEKGDVKEGKVRNRKTEQKYKGSGKNKKKIETRNHKRRDRGGGRLDKGGKVKEKNYRLKKGLLQKGRSGRKVKKKIAKQQFGEKGGSWVQGDCDGGVP